MKIRLEMEVDLASGVYDVRFHNLTHPGEDIDVHKLRGIVGRVLENVASKGEQGRKSAEPWTKTDIN